MPAHARACALSHTHTDTEFFVTLYSQFRLHFIKPVFRKQGLRRPLPLPLSSAKAWKVFRPPAPHGGNLGWGWYRGNWELGQACWATHSPCQEGSWAWRGGSRTSPACLGPEELPSTSRAGTLTILCHPPLQPHPSMSVSHPHPVPEYIQMYSGALPGFHLPRLSLPPSPPLRRGL